VWVIWCYGGELWEGVCGLYRVMVVRCGRVCVGYME
jgi:hypothetical protein